MKTIESVANDIIVKRFELMHANKRLAHAYLFIGPEGIGKDATALGVAQTLNCLEESGSACGTCEQCKKIAAVNHPDVFVIDNGPQEKVKIDEVRFLIERLQLRPFEGRTKIFIVKRADLLTLQASNALLKTLEEPTRDSLIILTTTKPENILATIRSRCHQVVFPPLSDAALCAAVKESMRGSDEEAQCIAYLADGCLNRAQQMVDDNFMQKRNEVVDAFVYNRSNDAYVKKILADKGQTKEVLAILLSWFRDVLMMKAGSSSRYLIHGDRLDDLQELQGKYSFNELKGIVTEIVNTLRLLFENLNVKIPFLLIKERIWAR